MSGLLWHSMHAALACKSCQSIKTSKCFTDIKICNVCVNWINAWPMRKRLDWCCAQTNIAWKTNVVVFWLGQVFLIVTLHILFTKIWIIIALVILSSWCMWNKPLVVSPWDSWWHTAIWVDCQTDSWPGQTVMIKVQVSIIVWSSSQLVGQLGIGAS